MLAPPLDPPSPDLHQLLSVTAVPDPRPGRAVVEAVGEVDAYTAPLLDACLQSQAGRPGLRELVVDLRQVTFLGAAGVAVLARADRRCRRRGARLVVRTGDRRPRRGARTTRRPRASCAHGGVIRSIGPSHP